MTNKRSSLPDDGGGGTNTTSDPTAIAAFTPERVQSILDSRNQHPPFFLSLFYYDPAKIYCAAITEGLEIYQARVPSSRNLTSDEIYALMDHLGASTNIALASTPTATAVALFLAWRGRARFRFPFWQPKWVNTSPVVFPSIAKPWLYEKTARLAWHTSRLVTYGVLCNWVVPFFFLPYAHVRGTLGISWDPRLHGVFKELA